LSTTLTEQPKAEATTPEPRKIRHPQDIAVLRGFGATVDDPALIDEYFEYRETFGLGYGTRPGGMPEATLLELRLRQKRRQAKAKK
jgi:hypothetical protein